MTKSQLLSTSAVLMVLVGLFAAFNVIRLMPEPSDSFWWALLYVSIYVSCQGISVLIGEQTEKAAASKLKRAWENAIVGIMLTTTCTVMLRRSQRQSDVHSSGYGWDTALYVLGIGYGLWLILNAWRKRHQVTESGGSRKPAQPSLIRFVIMVACGALLVFMLSFNFIRP